MPALPPGITRNLGTVSQAKECPTHGPLEPLPSWKLNKAESEDKASPGMQGCGELGLKQATLVGGGGLLGDCLGSPGEKDGYQLESKPHPAPPPSPLPDSPTLPPRPHSLLPHLLFLTPITTHSPGPQCMKTRRDSQFPCPYLDIPGLPGGPPNTPLLPTNSPGLYFPASWLVMGVL